MMSLSDSFDTHTLVKRLWHSADMSVSLARRFQDFIPPTHNASVQVCTFHYKRCLFSFTVGQRFSVRVLYFIRLLVACKRERNRKHQLARTSRKCCVWLLSILVQKKVFVLFFASNLSCSGNNHVSSLFTNEEQGRKKKKEKKKKEKKGGGGGRGDS